jgi:anti-anti-sigma regulatory factor
MGIFLSAQIDSATKEKLGQMNSSWANKLIIDLRAVTDVNMNVIQLIISLVRNSGRTKIPSCMVTSADQANTLKGFHETGTMETVRSVEQAKAILSA